MQAPTLTMLVASLNQLIEESLSTLPDVSEQRIDPDMLLQTLHADTQMRLEPVPPSPSPTDVANFLNELHSLLHLQVASASMAQQNAH